MQVIGTLTAAWRIARYGSFAHRAYAKRYLGNARLAAFSLPHFLCVGEARGYRPNAFFDPRFFSARSHGARYADYLRDQRLWVFSTSADFDVGWYLDHYAGEVATHENPLLHFLCCGFARGYAPNPRFDVAFFKKAVLRDSPNVEEETFQILTADTCVACTNASDLREAQKRFRETLVLHPRRVLSGARRRDLLFVQAGRDYRLRFSPTRNYDVLVNYYEAAFPLPDDAEYVFHQKGTKATAVAKLLALCPDILLGYESVMLLDDDVAITQDQIGALFDLRTRHALDLLQPALSERSASFFPMLKQPFAGTGVRAMTAVEIMMPIVSRRVFAAFGHVFSESVSGWGLDFLLGRLVRERFGETVALAADIECEHLRPVDLEHGRFYRLLAEAGISPAAEAGHLAMTYKLNDKINAIRPVAPFSHHQACEAAPCDVAA